MHNLNIVELHWNYKDISYKPHPSGLTYSQRQCRYHRGIVSTAIADVSFIESASDLLPEEKQAYDNGKLIAIANILVTISTPELSEDKNTSLLPAISKKIEAPHVAILMCTYDGERFISEQLNSIEQQTHDNWTLIVSDDDSRDKTPELLQEFRERTGVRRVTILEGPKQGFSANFISLTARSDTQADFYAWADQDDLWHANKIETAVAWLTGIPQNRPALYCGRCKLINASGSPIGLSPLSTRPPRFANALVQCIAGGNTMIFNRAALILLQEAGEHVSVASHDWWAYQLISGAGGIIHYDPQPTISYRQHEKNLVGSNLSWVSRLKRIRMLLQGRFQEWNTQNIRALEKMHHCLTQENVAILINFKNIRNEKILHRLASLKRAGLYRQTFLSHLGLIFATLMKKI